MWHRSCRDAHNRMKLDRIMKGKMPIGIHSSNGHARVYFCSHGEEADIKMIVHVADAVENDLHSVIIRTFAPFSRSVSPTVLGPRGN